MFKDINPNHPPWTDLLRAGRVLGVLGPTTPGMQTIVNLSRGDTTYEPVYVQAGQGQNFGPFNFDIQYSVSSNGPGSTVSNVEHVIDSGSGSGPFPAAIP